MTGISYKTNYSLIFFKNNPYTKPPVGLLDNSEGITWERFWDNFNVFKAKFISNHIYFLVGLIDS